MSMRTTERRYDPRELDAKWQERWDRDKLYQVRDDDPRPKWYELTMYPYPSGDLHIGHWYAMAPADAHARFRRMQGYNVLHPMGFDAFGLPAENAAIRRGIHPYQWTMSNIENMRRQLSSMGSTYDWDREIICAQPEYYRWNQWIFLQFYKAGLAYRAKAPANWCPSCQTVLANEQVVDGKCERCESPRLPPGPGAVVPGHHKVRRGAPGLLRPPGLAREDQGHADQLDWPQRRRGDQFRHLGVRSGGDRNPHLHHSYRHHLRRHLCGHCAGAPPGGQADHAGPPGGGRRLHRAGAAAVGDGAAVHGAREIGRLHRLLRSQPPQRGPGAHLRCRLRAANLRHGNCDGRSRS